eukprot:TRINITY_DN3282_c0_g1_i1.p1 TRINITY_DN3282_c0_g1~~TRINITY_DN3282_c0_g1_i1.p1  ORF type:complete len:666 (+),score=165.43 TRINITY_DN3282_c0_g1_i1:71-2068(+)
MSHHLEPGGPRRANLRRLKRFSNTISDLDEQLSLDGPMTRSPRRRRSSRGSLLPPHVPRNTHSVMDETGEESTLDVVVDLSEEPSSLLSVVEDKPTDPRKLNGCIFFPLLTMSRYRVVWNKELQRKIRMAGGECRTKPTSDVTHIITDLRTKNEVKKALSKCRTAFMRHEKTSKPSSSGGGGGWVRALVGPDGSISSHLDLKHTQRKREREGNDVIQDDDVWSGNVKLIAPMWIPEILKGSPTADGFVLSFREDSSCPTSQVLSSSIDVESMVKRLASSESGKDSKQENSKHCGAKMSSYACSKTWTLQEGPTSEKEGANIVIMEKLGELRDLYEMLGDQFRTQGYQRAVSAIENHDNDIMTTDDVERVAGLGKGVQDKIKEYMKTGTISRLEHLRKSERVEVISLFTKIHGVGVSTANEWYSRGYRTLDDIRKNVRLSHGQQVGLDLYNDLEQKIPRSEVELIEHATRKVVEMVGPKDMELRTCGSYRRGKLTCGDVDILIRAPPKDAGIDSKTSRDCQSLSDDFGGDVEHHPGAILRPIIDRLHTEGLLTHDLSYSACEIKASYMGVIRLSTSHLHRRIDIKVYSDDVYAPALLYFTGSGYFNRSMRLLARKAGYRLSDEGIWKAKRNEKVCTRVGDPIVCKNEEDIFRILGLEYRVPSERNA